MRLFNFVSCKMCNGAWAICYTLVLAFAAGAIVDIDHPISKILGIDSGRFLMPYFGMAGLVLLGCGIGLLITCVCRYKRLGILGGDL